MSFLWVKAANVKKPLLATDREECGETQKKRKAKTISRWRWSNTLSNCVAFLNDFFSFSFLLMDLKNKSMLTLQVKQNITFSVQTKNGFNQFFVDDIYWKEIIFKHSLVLFNKSKYFHAFIIQYFCLF